MASPFQNPNHDSEFISNFSLMTLEDFKIFHSIDRQLYTRLVISLGHDPTESMHVMALLLWLERSSTSNLYLVNRLLKLPDTILYHVVEEIASVLKVVQNDDFPYIHEDVNSSKIPLLQTLMSKHDDDDDDVTLKFFHSHRLGLVRGVTHLMNEICFKVFNDIMQKVVKNCQQSLFHFSPMMENVASRPPGFNTNPRIMSLQSGIIGSNNGATIAYDPRTYIKATATQRPYDLHVQRDTMNAQIEEILHEVYVTCIEGDNNGRGATSEVPPDDRTIFLTFSKGYPISKSEVGDFFTRRNGDAIDSIYMQEVSSHEQILYARMVVKSQGLVDVILGGKDVKAKFTINGKHVWGRKYVKKKLSCSFHSNNSIRDLDPNRYRIIV